MAGAYLANIQKEGQHVSSPRGAVLFPDTQRPHLSSPLRGRWRVIHRPLASLASRQGQPSVGCVVLSVDGNRSRGGGKVRT